MQYPAFIYIMTRKQVNYLRKDYAKSVIFLHDWSGLGSPLKTVVLLKVTFLAVNASAILKPPKGLSLLFCFNWEHLEHFLPFTFNASLIFQ